MKTPLQQRAYDLLVDNTLIRIHLSRIIYILDSGGSTISKFGGEEGNWTPINGMQIRSFPFKLHPHNWSDE